MKEKILELLKGAERKVKEQLTEPLSLNEWLDIYADHLIENGVIVPRPEMGGMVYTIKFRGGHHHYTRMYNDRLEIVLKPYKPIGKTMIFKKFGYHPTEKGGGSDA